MENQKESVSAKFSDDLYQAAIRSFNYNAINVLKDLIEQACKEDLSFVFNTEKYNDESSLTNALEDAASYWKKKNFFIYHLINHYLEKKDKYSIETFMGLTNVLFLINMNIPMMAAKDYEAGDIREDPSGVRRVTRILYPLELSVEECKADKQDSAHAWCLGKDCGRACFRWTFFPWKDVTIFHNSEPVKTQTLGKQGFDEFFKVAQFALADCSYNAVLSSPFRTKEGPIYIADVLFPALFNEPILFRDMRPLDIGGEKTSRERLYITRRWPDKMPGEEVTKYECKSGFTTMNHELGIVSEAIIPLCIPDEFYVEPDWNNPWKRPEEKHGLTLASMVVELYSPIPDWFAFKNVPNEFKCDNPDFGTINVDLNVLDKKLREDKDANTFWCPTFPKYCSFEKGNGMVYFNSALTPYATVGFNLSHIIDNRSYEFFRWLLISLRSSVWERLPGKILDQYFEEKKKDKETVLNENSEFREFYEWARNSRELAPRLILRTPHVGIFLIIATGFRGEEVALKNWPNELVRLAKKESSDVKVREGVSLKVRNDLLPNCNSLDLDADNELKRLSNSKIYIGPMEEIICEIMNNVIKHKEQDGGINIHMCIYKDFNRQSTPVIHIFTPSTSLNPDEYMLLRQCLPGVEHGIGIMANRYSIEGGCYKSGEYIVELNRHHSNETTALSSPGLLASEYRRGLHTWILIDFEKEE